MARQFGYAETARRAGDSGEAMANLLDRRSLLAGGGASALCGPAALPASARTCLAERTLAINPAGGPRYGRKSYAEALPLEPGEVVLTFDDGPLPGPTTQVLDALQAYCVHATFFVIGRNVRAHPELARRIARAGHGIANHTENHLWTLRQQSEAVGIREIEAGEATLRSVLGAGNAAVRPFFRFPGFADTAATLAHLSATNRAVLGCDFWASDWNAMSPEAQLSLVWGRLRRAGRGIVLFHDVRPQTAAMLPAFLAALAGGGYRVVHLTA